MLKPVYIHCNDCGDHLEVLNRSYEIHCNCSSNNYTSVDGQEPGKCQECDDIYEEVYKDRK